MTPPYDVVVFEPNAVFLDFIFEGLPSMPKLGHEIFARNLTIAPGGAYNCAAAMACLGLNVALVAQIGDDMISRYLEHELKEAGVDTAHLNRVKGQARALTVALTFPEDRAFVSYLDRDDLHHFPESLLDPKKTKILLLASMIQHPSAIKLAQNARQAGITVAMDMHNPWGSLDIPKVRRILSSVDIILPNAVEARQVAGVNNVRQALKSLNKHTTAVIKDGPKGALGYDDGQTLRITAPKVKAVDTTGAGDNFNAGFLSGLVDGKPFDDCLARGCACGSLAVQQPGGATSSPDRKALSAMLKRMDRSL